MPLKRKLKRLLAKTAFARAGRENRADEDFKRVAQGPTEQQSVYWIGHSLMQQTVTSSRGDINLFNCMQAFAEQRGLSYHMFDHTLFGAPLSLQWRGCPHSYQRYAPEMESKRQQFAEQAKHFDTFVLTEIVPVKSVIELEFSAYYLQQYYELIRQVNPRAKVYLYESWDYLYGSRSSLQPYQYDWRSEMDKQRGLWQDIADSASLGCAVSPNSQAQIRSILSPSKPNKDAAPILLVPVGQVFTRVFDRLKAPQASDDFRLSNSERLAFEDLFANPYNNWPEEWPLCNGERNGGRKGGCNDRTPENLQASLDSLSLKTPHEELDDIHPSEVGIYLVALAHFATLYRQSPVGLDPTPAISTGLATTLQNIVWEVVNNDTRSGVRA